MKIKSIKIEAFRGIPHLDRDIKGKSLIIHGENGTGKSSIIDAIEFFFTGKVSHLSRSFSTVRNQGKHVKFLPEDVKISLEMNPGSCLLERTINSAPSCPKPLEDYFKLAENGKFILRRSQILEFINSTPAERYKFIGKIIDIEELEKIEKALKGAKDKIQKAFDNENESITEIKEKIQLILEEETYTDDILPVLNTLLIKEGFTALKSIDEIDEYVKKLEENIKSPDYDKLYTLNDIQKKIDKINSLDENIVHLFEETNNLKDEIIKNHNLADLSLIELLKKSKNIIDAKTNSCPVCENSIEGEKVLEQIDVRLKELEILKGKEKELTDSLKEINEYFRSIYSNLGEIKEKMSLFEDFSGLENIIIDEQESISSLSQEINSDSFINGKSNLEDYTKLRSSQEQFLLKIVEKSNGLERQLKPSKKDEKVSDICEKLLETNKNIKKLNNSNQILSKIEKELKTTTKLHEKFLEVRKRKIQELYDAIEEDIQNFYNILHPNELHENIKLNIDTSRRASTNLRMTIFGIEDEDPRALNSEGHLDSLGLCIFLALFKNFNKDFPIMALDDVVSTMDSQHRGNVCNLLFEEFGDKQLIITTHDDIWFEQLKAAQRAYGMEGKFENIRIIGWDLESGLEIRPYKPRWKKIEEKIDDGDKNCAGNEGRRYLEWLLQDICTNSKAKVMMNPSGRFEINDLFDPAKQRLEKLIKDEEFKKNVSQSFKNLKKTIIMGNLLSHENLMAGNVSIDEVRRFCESVHEIHELMLCNECGNPLKYNKEFKIFRCSGKKCLNPLEIKAK